MHKVLLLAAAVVAAVMASGCAIVGRHSVPVEGGVRTTVGLFAFDAIGDGYPMIPCFSSIEFKKK